MDRLAVTDDGRVVWLFCTVGRLPQRGVPVGMAEGQREMLRVDRLRVMVEQVIEDELPALRQGEGGCFEQTDPLEFGMRDQEHSFEKQANIYRVLVLGDSFMEALQVPFERSFPYLLSQRWNDVDHKRVEVINAAVSGWGTDDELAYLVRFGVRFKPDLILVAMTLTNDLNDNLVQEFYTLANGRLIAHSPAESGAAV